VAFDATFKMLPDALAGLDDADLERETSSVLPLLTAVSGAFSAAGWGSFPALVFLAISGAFAGTARAAVTGSFLPEVVLRATGLFLGAARGWMARSKSSIEELVLGADAVFFALGGGAVGASPAAAVELEACAGGLGILPVRLVMSSGWSPDLRVGVRSCFVAAAG
jgi:hypothetical protein